MDIHDLRKQYEKDSLLEKNLSHNPFDLFEQWFREAQQKQVNEPNAMVLSTVSDSGKPSARVVLLKFFDESGFVFFTNYQSRKGKQLANNNYAALTFFWQELERQVRIEGRVEKVATEISKKYFYERPIESRVSAIVSPQSTPQSRQFLDDAYQELLLQSDAQPLEYPSFWGGYIVIPELIEFWQGRPNRLHDRIEYVVNDGKWTFRRLAP